MNSISLIIIFGIEIFLILLGYPEANLDNRKHIRLIFLCYTSVLLRKSLINRKWKDGILKSSILLSRGKGIRYASVHHIEFEKIVLL
ncbi:hypothetical protein evm_010654 [Chilo suppressalis]|nr:hypothetical protein evm_010654 [Chilo suppressalis]